MAYLTAKDERNSMKQEEVVDYIKRQYFDSIGTPIKGLEDVVESCFLAKEEMIRVSEDWDARKNILVDLEHNREALTLYRILAPDGDWEQLLTTLRINKVTARDIQSIRSTISAGYKRLLKEAEQEAYEEMEVTTIRGVKSFVAENGRDGIVLKIVYM